jgi:hypothetical protein
LGFRVAESITPEPSNGRSTLARPAGPAKPGHQIENDWNTFDIESRDDMIRVKLNDYLVSQYAGEKGRSKTGPIGLQLHDKTSVVMFRNIRIKEVKPHK